MTAGVQTFEIGGYKDSNGQDIPKYTIPKGAIIIGNVYAVHHNEGGMKHALAICGSSLHTNCDSIKPHSDWLNLLLLSCLA